MNIIQTIDTEYLRSDRTIDTVLINRGSKSKTLWIYNSQGVHFRVFENLLDVHNFLSNSFEAKFSFDQEEALDSFLLNYPI